MIDREKVIKGLNNISRDIVNTLGCGEAIPYLRTIDDAIALLKEQEVVEPKKVKGYNPPMYTLYEYECKECKSPMMNKQPFCMGCGRPVKWE